MPFTAFASNTIDTHLDSARSTRTPTPPAYTQNELRTTSAHSPIANLRNTSIIGYPDSDTSTVLDQAESSLINTVGVVESSADTTGPTSPCYSGLKRHAYHNSPPMLDTRLPQELIHIIIDPIMLDHDPDYWGMSPARKILQTCSLISKAWVPKCRQYLFRHISLPRERRPGYRCPLSFLDLLDSPLETLTPHVRDLALRGCASDPFLSDPFWSDYYRLDEVLPRLTAMTAVESFSIDVGRFENLGAAAIADFISSFNRLTQLRLSRCSFSSGRQLSLVLSAASRFERLELGYVQFLPRHSFSAQLQNLARMMQIPGFAIIPRSVPNHTRIFKIRGRGLMDVFLEWLPPVDTVEFTYQNNLHNSFSRLIRRVGSSLTSLVFVCKDDHYWVDDITAFYSTATDAPGHCSDLEHNHHHRCTIRSLCIYGLFQGDVLRILNEIKSPCIKEISFRAKTTTLNWDIIGQFLARPNFSHLKQVNVTDHTCWPGSREQILSRLADRLPVRHPRGIFHLTFTGSYS